MHRHDRAAPRAEGKHYMEGDKPEFKTQPAGLMCSFGNEANTMRLRTAERKVPPTGKVKKRPVASASSDGRAMARTDQTVDPTVRPRLEKALTELRGLHQLLLAGDIDPRVLADFRDALNRVRTAAWAAQQYVARKETDEGPSSVLSFLAGERVRAAYHLCQALNDDLKRTDIELQAGSLVQLYEAARGLTEQLESVVDRLG